jgi:hypothetical protein
VSALRHWYAIRRLVPDMVASPFVPARLVAQPEVVIGSNDQVAPNPVLTRDLAVLVGLLAELEGGLKVGEVPEHLAERFRDRFVREGLLDPPVRPRDLRQAIHDLNQRLRYGLGEYPEPPEQTPITE